MDQQKQVIITKKLIASFCVLILIFLLYGLFTLYNIHSISRLTRTIYNHPLVVSNAALQSNVSITKIHRDMKDVVLFKSAQKIQHAIEAVNRQEQFVYQYLDTVRNNILGEEGKLLENESRKLFADWRPIREEVIQLVHMGRKEDAAAITVGKGADHVVKLEEKMLALTTYARNKASLFVSEANKTHSRSELSTILFLTLSLLVSLMIGFFTLKQTASTEKELRDSKQLLTNAIDYAPIGMTLLQPNGKFYKVNQAYCDMTGYSEQELLGMNFQDITPPDDRDIGHEIIQKITRGEIERATLEKRYAKKDGGIIDVYLTTSLLKDKNGLPLYFFTQAQDITHRKQAEKELKKSQEKYRSMMESITDPLYICSPDLKVEYMNPAMKKRIGKDAVGEPCYKAIHDLDETCDWCIFEEVSHGETIETTVVSPKDNRSYQVNNMPMHNQDGSVSKMTIFRDITDYLTALKEKEKATAQLLEVQKMESIGHLAGGIAHDFNNILSSILGFTELTLDDMVKGSKAEENLQAVYTAGKRARDLVKQILTFARQNEDEVQPIQIDTIVKEVLKFIRSSIPTTIEIKQNIESHSVIMGNSTQAHQILMNLCTNAAHAMENEVGILDVSLKDVKIDMDSSMSNVALKPGDYIEIKVSDTGVGIPSDIIGSIFDPYFTTKAPGKGTGMGLSVVHGIVESYGGKVLVESLAGKGTIFSVYLPAMKNRHKHKAYEQQELPRGKERILFVDDEGPIVKMGRQTLERLGYSVTTATSSVEALELFQATPNDFDLVITDTTMPKMTGDELAMELMGIRPDIPVILCTGYSNKISIDTAEAIGIKAFVHKPIVKGDLATTVRNILDKTEIKQSTGCILLIDDEPAFRKLFIRKFEDSGYKIIEAGNGKEGLELFHKHSPNLVVTDLVMPEKEGIETIRELKSEFPDVNIIAVSGGGRNNPDAYLHIAKKVGAKNIFSKPIDWEELIKAVKDLAN